MVSAPDLHGMATTASAVLIDGCTAAVAHVGDSRVYVLRDRRLERLTRDHSWVEEQVRKGCAQRHGGTASSVAKRRDPGAVGR